MPTLSSLAPSNTFTPALKPPPGVTPDPVHPASLVHNADIAMGICIPLVTISFLLRTYVRAYLKKVWILEDALVTIGWAGTVAFCGIMRAIMSNYGGKHGWDITSAQAHQAAYWFNVAAIEYGVVICVTKVAILCLYRRVFSPVRRSRFDITIITFIVIMVGFYGITSFFKIFECSPREKIWNKSVPGKCVQISWILNISGGFNTLTDYMILLLPVHAVQKLQMDRGKKILVVLAFTFGLCAPIFATVGFVVRLKNSANPDKSWKQPEITLWGAAELTSGNLCVCFPELTALVCRKSRKALSGPNRRTASEHKGWSGRHSNKKKPSPDAYIPKSLMSTTFSTNGESNYIELDDRS